MNWGTCTTIFCCDLSRNIASITLSGNAKYPRAALIYEMSNVFKIYDLFFLICII